MGDQVQCKLQDDEAKKASTESLTEFDKISQESQEVVQKLEQSYSSVKIETAQQEDKTSTKISVDSFHHIEQESKEIVNQLEKSYNEKEISAKETSAEKAESDKGEKSAPEEVKGDVSSSTKSQDSKGEIKDNQEEISEPETKSEIISSTAEKPESDKNEQDAFGNQVSDVTVSEPIEKTEVIEPVMVKETKSIVGDSLKTKDTECSEEIEIDDSSKIQQTDKHDEQ